MPTVPTYSNLQTAQSGQPPVAYQAPLGSTNAASVAGSEIDALGGATQRAGDAAAQISLSMQDVANQVRVNDAVNKARQAAQDLAYNPDNGYLNLKGDAALTRPSGLDLPTEYGDKLKAELGNISATLGNDAQRRQFQLNATDLQSQFHGQVESHMLGEFRSHALSVQDGTIDLASDDAKRNWSDPDLIAPSLEAAKAAVYQKGQVNGWSASQTQAAMLATTSKVHTDVVMAALENSNPSYALNYLNARKGEMTADDILRVQGQVNQSVWTGQAQGAVQTATTANMSRIAPTSFDRMAQVVAQTESGGRETNPDGSTVTSPKGALGVMQVMPDTMRNPGFGMQGIDPDTATPAQRAQFGRDYLQMLTQRYGDPAKVFAAYNAGPSALDKALKTGGDWLSQMPKETQDYVAKNVAAYGSPTGGIPPRPTELDFVNSAINALPAGAPPQVVKLTREQAVSQFAIINRSANEQGDNAQRTAQQWLAANNGDFANMPPSIRDPVTQYAPGKVDELLRYSRALAKGENTTDLTLYNRLAAHPDEMAGMSDAQFESLMPSLSQADFKHFSNERATYLNGRNDDSAAGINSPAINRSLNTRLESLQINTTPGPKDLDGRERLGGIQQFVRNSIFAAQAQTGKKMTPAEIDAHVDGLFSKDVTFRTSFMGISTGSTTPAPLMSLQIGDLPTDTVQQLRDSFAKRDKANPTNTDLLNAYRTYKLGQTSSATQ